MILTLLFTVLLFSNSYFNSAKNTNTKIYSKVLSESESKYHTLEISKAPTKNNYYFVPTLPQESKYAPVSFRPTIPGVMASALLQPATWEEGLTLPANSSKEDFIMNEINNHRISKGLSKSQPDSSTCNFAKLRVDEISANFNHDGFTQRINNNTLPYPSYSQITENISVNSDYKMVASKWIESSGHAANMEKDTPFICVKSSGDYYAMEGWKP